MSRLVLVLVLSLVVSRHPWLASLFLSLSPSPPTSPFLSGISLPFYICIITSAAQPCRQHPTDQQQQQQQQHKPITLTPPTAPFVSSLLSFIYFFVSSVLSARRPTSLSLLLQHNSPPSLLRFLLTLSARLVFLTAINNYSDNYINSNIFQTDRPTPHRYTASSQYTTTTTATTTTPVHPTPSCTSSIPTHSLSFSLSYPLLQTTPFHPRLLPSRHHSFPSSLLSSLLSSLPSPPTSPTTSQ